ALSLCRTGEFTQAEKLMAEVSPSFIELLPGSSAAVLRELANRNGAEQNWQKAASQFYTIFFGEAQRGLSNTQLDALTMDYLTYAPLLVQLGDTANYQRLRESARAEVGPDSLRAERMLNAFLLLPFDKDFAPTIDKWGATAAKPKPTDRYIC